MTLKNYLNKFDTRQLRLLRYSNDPVSFTTDILGLECKNFHQEWLEAFENNRFTVLLAPRGHGKTSLVGSYILWRICRNRRLRALILTINQDKANHMMTFVQENLRNNPKLIDIFGSFYRGGLEWSRDELRVSQVEPNYIPQNEPTLKVLGITSRILTAHYDLIVLDDITDDENSRTEARREKLQSIYDGPIIGTFLSNTKVIDIGTKWHESDIHSYLSHKIGFKTLKYKALLNQEEVDNGEKARVLWPKHLPWDEEMAKNLDLPIVDILTLKFIREHQGELYFQMQYQNEIIPSAIAKFKIEWLNSAINKYRELGGSIPMNLKKYMGIDIGGEDNISDWCVFTVIGIDDNGDIYIIDQIRTHASLHRQVDIMKGLDDKWHVSSIGIDAAAQQKIITDDIIKQNPSLPLKQIKSSRAGDIDTRMDRLSILFETGRIYLNPVYKHLMDELKMYPRGRWDDCLASLAFALECSGDKGTIDWKKVPGTILTKRTYDMRLI